VLSLSPTPITTSTKERKEGRNFINKNLSDLVQRVIAKKSAGMAAFIEENEGNYNAATDFEDERHLTPLAIERIIGKLDEILPSSQRLKDARLKGKPTCKPYRGCYGTYPTGCNFCTTLNHTEQRCNMKNGGNKRNRSSGSEDHGLSQKKSKST